MYRNEATNWSSNARRTIRVWWLQLRDTFLEPESRHKKLGKSRTSVVAVKIWTASRHFFLEQEAVRRSSNVGGTSDINVTECGQFNFEEVVINRQKGRWYNGGINVSYNQLILFSLEHFRFGEGEGSIENLHTLDIKTVTNFISANVGTLFMIWRGQLTSNRSSSIRLSYPQIRLK